VYLGTGEELSVVPSDSVISTVAVTDSTLPTNLFAMDSKGRSYYVVEDIYPLFRSRIMRIENTGARTEVVSSNAIQDFFAMQGQNPPLTFFGGLAVDRKNDRLYFGLGPDVYYLGEDGKIKVFQIGQGASEHVSYIAVGERGDVYANVTGIY